VIRPTSTQSSISRTSHNPVGRADTQEGEEQIQEAEVFLEGIDQRDQPRGTGRPPARAHRPEQIPQRVVQAQRAVPHGGPGGLVCAHAAIDHFPLQLHLVQDDLTTERLGRKFHYFFELDSTNRYARSLAEHGAVEGEVVIAEQQTRGRGRLGRPWISPPYLNLYFSVVLRPTLPAEHAPQITLAAAVAVADAVDAFSPIPAAIKWPNDILVDGKKLAGILIEGSTRPDRLEYLVLGIGINVNFPLEPMPPAIRGRATSLFAIRQQKDKREALILL
jgi:hypothetical protein